MIAAKILLVVVVILVLGGLVEIILHRRNLARIPIRIHVSGTRGKSSVTRLIAAGLREGGIATCAKTTGTLARMILPDGSEFPIYRPSQPNIIEQVRILSTAVSYKARALVLECMALQPQLHWLSESKLVRATHGVITNAREDHLDVMGPTETDVALALASMVPVGGKLYTGERKHYAIFEYAAKDRGTEIIQVGSQEAASVTREDMAGFSYVEHEENVALALRICMDLGVPREVALRGMWRARPDPGVMSTHRLDFFGRNIWFVNGFAANDPESTEHIWNIALDRFPDVARRVAIFNCRLDRPDRSQQLGRACVRWRPADYYVLIGGGTYIFGRAACKAGLDMRKIVFAEHRDVADLFELVIDLAGSSCLVMGMGNIGGMGLDLVRYFRNRSIVTGAA